MLTFYADQHVVGPLIRALRKRGVDVVTVQECGQSEATDAELLAEAFVSQRAMLTNDVNFLALADESASQGQLFAPIFYWPQQRRSVGHLLKEIVREANGNDFDSASSRVFFL